MAHLIPNDPEIRYHYQPSFGSIGTKRNAGCELASGEVITHFDDDDFSGPSRLSDQIKRLVESGVAVTGYHKSDLTDGQRWWRYNGEPHYAIGASLCYWRSYWEAHRFPDKQVGEDGDFVMRARPVLAATQAGRDLFYYTVHPGNTSPRQLGTKQYQEL